MRPDLALLAQRALEARPRLGEARGPAEAVQRRTQVPIAMAAQSLLAAANLAAAPHVDVALPGAGVDGLRLNGVPVSGAHVIAVGDELLLGATALRIME